MNFPSELRTNETNVTPARVAVRKRTAIAGRVRGSKVLWRALAASAVVLMALVGGSTAALAHDQLDGTSPADGSTVASMPEHVTLTMSNTPATIGSQINVVDASGTNWSQGGVSVLDNIATQQLKPGAPAGKYTVKWRLVSSDSHPVEGVFTFTATAGGASSGAVAGPAQSAQQVSEAASQPAPDSGGIPWSVFGLIGVLVVVVVAMIVVARRRLGSED